MTDVARARKLAVRIREIVADTLRTQVKDPRLGMVTVTDARITGDLRDATVFYTVLGDDTERAATAAALESAKGVLRSAVGRRTGVKFTPTLTFEADIVPDTAREITDLLAKAREADEELQRRAAGAVYAGEPDPYRSNGDDVDSEDGGATEDAAAAPGTDGGETDTGRADGTVRADPARADGARVDGVRADGRR